MLRPLFCSLFLLSAATAQAQVTPEPILTPEPAAAVVPLTTSPEAHAVLPQPVSHLGGTGQFFLGGAVGAAIGGHTIYDDTTRSWGDQRFDLTLAPKLGMFITDSLFFSIDGAYTMQVPGAPNDTVSVEPGIGYRVPMGRKHAFLPNLGYLFRASRTTADLPINDTNAWRGTHGGFIDLPAMFEVAPHLGLTVGPRVRVSYLGNENVDIHYLVNFGLLGWL